MSVSQQNPVSRAFANMKIRKKILTGFLVVLALLATVGAIGFSSLFSLGGTFDTYSRVADASAKVLMVERNVVGLRRNVLAYIANPDEKIAQRFRELAAELKKEVPETLDAIASPERKAVMASSAKPIDGYIANFDNVVKLRSLRDKLYNDKMVPLGSKASENLTATVKSAMAEGATQEAALAGMVQETLMLARINALRFLSSPDAKQVDAVNQLSVQLQREGADLAQKSQNPERKTLVTDALDMMKGYQAAFVDVAKATLDLDPLVNKTMADQAAEATKILGDLRAAQMKVLDAMELSVAASVSSSLMTVGVLVLSALAAGFVLALVIGKAIAAPVIGMTGAMKTLAAGDTKAEIPACDRKDEIGEMAGAVQVFKDNMIESDRLRAEQEKMKAEQEEAKKRAELEKKAAMQKLANDFEASISGVVNTVSSASTELQTTAQSMSATAEQTNQQSAAVAAASEEASTNVQTVATAGEELSASITEISRQVSQSSQMTQQAVEQATRTNAQIQSLAEAAQKIGDVVKLISDIAGQTNLLALNATIEAARAGEAGKGFAVVASEVKSLATQTAKATEEISAKINEMQAATSDSVQAIASISETISGINEIATTIASAIEEQGAATQEISRNVQQAAKGTQEVSSNIAGVTQAASDTGAAANQVLSSASELAKQGELLREKVDTFIATVRAA